MSIQNWKFKTTNNGNHFWEALDINNVILGRSSQDFKSKSGSQYNSDLLGRTGSFSQKLVWDIFENKTGGWSWKCDNTINKENVGLAHKSFDSKKDAVKNALLFGYNGEFASMSDNSNLNTNNTSFESKSAFTAPAANVNHVNHNNTNQETVKVSSTEKSYTNKSTYNNNSDEEGAGFGWWKWLLPLLLLLGLLFWGLPQLLGNKTELPKTDIKLPSVSSLTMPKISGIFDALKAPNFSALNIGIKSLGLDSLIAKAGPLTLLAPSNDAFAKIPADLLANLQKPENSVKFGELLKGHFLKGNIDLGSLKDGQTVMNLNGLELPVKVEGDKLFINNVEVDKTAEATSGDIKVYSIPTVLSFDNVKKDESMEVSSVAEVMTKVSMLQKLESAGNFKTLLAAIDAAELRTTLEGPGPFTIFAPNDAALAKITPKVEELLKPENKLKLQAFLKNHVVSGKNTFADFQARKLLTTLNGETVVIETTPGGIGQVVATRNTVSAPTPDIDTPNAVIHELIDSPIL